MFSETSDEFFARPEVGALIGTVDIAFIDGLHLFEQALRDFVNLESRMAGNGVVLFHDCLPPDAAWAQRVQRRGAVWAGDVWKVVRILTEYRPDLRVEVAATPPTGLGIVTGLDPENRVLAEEFDDIVARFMDAEFAPMEATLDGTWEAAASCFPAFRKPSLTEELGLLTEELIRKSSLTEKLARRSRRLVRKSRKLVERSWAGARHRIDRTPNEASGQ